MRAITRLMVVAALAALAQPWPLAFVIDSVLGRNAPPARRHPPGGGSSPDDLIVFAVAVSIVIVLINSIVGVINSYVNTKLDQRMALDFRSDLFAHCLAPFPGFPRLPQPGRLHLPHQLRGPSRRRDVRRDPARSSRAS